MISSYKSLYPHLHLPQNQRKARSTFETTGLVCPATPPRGHLQLTGALSRKQFPGLLQQLV